MEIPKRKRGRQSDQANEEYDAKLRAFCDAILQIDSTVDFKVSSRGWCYILEQHGLLKSDFDDAQRLINDCRKSGLLPLDICREDDNRTFLFVEEIDDTTPEEEAEDWIHHVLNRAWLQYNGFSFWDDQSYYVQMLVEKIDLVSLFEPICEKYRVPIANSKGWADISQRADMMRRFAEWEGRGKIPVLLYCGDHDPAGLAIKNHLRNNLRDLTPAVGWSPDNLIIDRFGLNFDFIKENNLTWIDNLMTGSAKDLADSKHPDHKKPYVQGYIETYGVRKCEANALVVEPEKGRQLCRDTLFKYIPEDAPARYEQEMQVSRLSVRDHIYSQLSLRFSG